MKTVNKSRANQARALDGELCLLGASGLADFISFVRKHTVDGKAIEEMQAADMWRDAAKIYHALEQTEAGAADNPEVLPLPADLNPYIKKLTNHPSFVQSFSDVPICFGMVELDKLVMSQFNVTQSTVNSLAKYLGKKPTNAQLAQVCLPMDSTKTNFELVKEGRDGYVFHSDSHDFRFLGAKLLEPEQLKHFTHYGYPSAVLALAVGFSSNVLNAVRYNNRIVLNNGYHRVCTMRSLGITHAPCVIQVCSHTEELGMAGAAEISDNSDLYFKAPRPPMLKDYFNPALTATFKTHAQYRQIQLKYSVDNIKLRKN
jgi:hypothetical protein